MKNFYKVFINLSLVFLIFFQTIKYPSANMGEGITKIAMGVGVGAQAIVDLIFVQVLVCDEIDLPTLIALAPVSLTSSATLQAEGVMNMLSGRLSKKSICAANVVTFKSLMLAYDALSKAKDIVAERKKNIPPPGSAALEAVWVALVIAIVSVITSAVLFWLAKGGIGLTTARDTTVCYQDDGNSPMPYTDEQISLLLQEQNLSVTAENINFLNEKLCLKYKGKNIWLKNGECYGGYDDPVCIQNMKGYQHILCASAPTACPCIYNIQNGIATVPEFKKDSNNNVVKDKDGNPEFTVDPSEYKSRFLKNCRISRIAGGDYQAKSESRGIVDESCMSLKGHSKRKFPITGGIAECFTNTARNIFEKPIFANMFSNETNIATENDYTLDLSLILNTQSNINDVTGGRTFNSLNDIDKGKVRAFIRELINGKTNQVYYVCKNGGSSYQSIDTKTFKDKYSKNNTAFAEDFNSNYKIPTKACCEVGDSSNPNAIVNVIKNYCYYDAITSKFLKEPEMTAIEVLASIESNDSNINYSDKQDFNSLFNSLFNEVQAKKNANDYIKILYNQKTLSNGEDILKWSLFDKFNNQIKFLSVFLLTLWLFLTGYRILVGEFKLSTPDLVSLLMQVGVFYYIVIADFWKTFLFSMVLSISQGIGMAAMEISNLSGQYTNNSCRYEPFTKNAVAMNGAKTVSCNLEDGIKYRLECTSYVDGVGCARGKCVSENPYIPRPNYEYPYIPVKYYNTNNNNWEDIPMYCTDSMTKKKTKAEKLLNSSLGYYLFYCPKGSVLDEGYTADSLELLYPGKMKLSQFSGNDVVTTALRTTNDFALVKNTTVVESNNKKEINKRVANAMDFENLRANLNYETNYPILKVYGYTRDMTYLKFFDRIDCKIMRFLFIGLGDPGRKDIDLSKMDVNNVTGGILSALKMIFGFFPFGILVFFLMIFIAITLLMITLRSLQSYVIGIFGLVMHAYVSPFFFMLSLFPSFKSAGETSIKNILSYAIVPPLSFLSLSIYFIILDIAFFGDPTKYSNLFDYSTGLVKSDCYDNDPGGAPLACVVSKITGKIDANQAYMNLILIITLGMVSGSWIGAAISANLLTSLFGVTDAIQLFIPFIMKLAVALFLIIGGISLMDTIENTLKGLVGMDANTKTGSFLDGGIKDVTGISAVSKGIGSLFGK